MALPSIQLGPYQLAERIGEGGNGTVYRATGPTGTVAVKLIPGAGDLDDAAVARFRREIAALGELSHPHLIPLLDHGVDAELGPYLVLPLLAGATLRELCKARALCPEAAVLLVLPVIEAAAALHAGGYVHRDLKPENAIATPDGAITVIDLGLAWGEGMSRHTESGAAVGSVGYMAPEQLDGRTVEASADVWALGVMLYEAVAGKRPFARPRPTEEVAATLLGAYARLTAADRRASDELAELVARCLATDPAARPTAHALADALRAQIDWVPLEQLAAERAAVIADPVGYQARIAAFRVRRLERLAREAIDAGKPFAALATCDRGLAYVPEHAGLLALIATAEAATAQRTPAAIAAPAVARHHVTSGATPVGGGAPAGIAAPRVESAAGVVAAPTVTTWRARRPVVLAIGATLLGVGGIVAIIALLAGPAEREDPWASRSGAPAAATSGEPPSMMAEGDRALLRDFVGLFGRAMDASDRSGAGATGPAPTTATGWFERAKTQAPADAVVSLRHALRTNPEWPAAQDALCVALAATKDQGAIEVCNQAIARRPTDVALRGARGTTLVLAGRPVEALADLDIVVAGDPAPMWRRVRAAARSAAGDDAGAAQDLEHACQLGDAVACQARR